MSSCELPIIAFECGGYITQSDANSNEPNNRSDTIIALYNKYGTHKNYRYANYRSNYIPKFKHYTNSALTDFVKLVKDWEILDVITEYFYHYYYAIYDNIKLHFEISTEINIIFNELIFNALGGDIFEPKEEEQFTSISEMVLRATIVNNAQDINQLPEDLLKKMYSFLFKSSIIADDYIKDKPIYIFDLRVVSPHYEIQCCPIDKLDSFFGKLNEPLKIAMIDAILQTYQHLYGHKGITKRVQWLINNDRINITRLFIFCFLYQRIGLFWSV